jgi:TonB-dependent starch-binding outer membrane protein SusC
MAAVRLIVLPLVAFLLLATPLMGQGQQGTITGRVVDSVTDQPLSGVTVTVGDRRTLTNAQGAFVLTAVPPGDHVVYAARFGYADGSQPVTVVAGQTVTVMIALPSEALALDRIVVTGYGERRVGDITGAVDNVGEGQFNTGRIVSAEELIQGRVAGLQVIDSGEPGGLVEIRIRGGTSVTASNQPLFVLDGVPLPVGGGLSAGRNPLNFLNPEDIESITVLKDASAAAIYGSRGANGVILVQTRRGSLREPQFSYTGSVSTSTVTRLQPMLNADEFRQVVSAVAPGRLRYLGDANTDWRDEVLRSGMGQEHSFSVAGAADKLNYRLSLGYLGQEGVIRGSQTERFSAALNADHRLLNDRLNIRAHLRGARTDDTFTPGGGLGAAQEFDPTQPIRTEAGYTEQWDFPLAVNNPIPELLRGIEEGVTYRSLASVEGEYRMPFLEAMTGTVRLGYDVAASERRAFYPTTLWGQQKSPNPGYVNRSNPRETTGLFDAYLTYSAPVGATSDIDFTAGHSYELSRGDYPFQEAFGLSTDLLGPSGIPTSEQVVTRLSDREGRLSSFFARANYSFDNRYLATLSVRRDGSSKFGPGNQWGTFPSAAVAWRLSEESFFQGTDWLSDLKLRASWGVTGNQSFGDYMWAAAYRYGDAFTQVQWGNEFITTIRPNAVDPNIKWEETTSYNLGLDYGILNNRIVGSVDYYLKDTDDLIFRVPVAAGTFLSNFVTTNIGSMRNQGLEFGLNARVLEGALRWNAGFTAATNRNELLSINPFGDGTDRILVGGIAGGVGSTIQILQPGFAVNTFFVHRHRLDAQGRPVSSGSLLDRYEDVDGDGTITIDDRVAIHSPAPSWMLGHYSQFDYGNIGLSFSLRANLGNYVYNNLASQQGYYNRLTEAAGPVNLHRSVSRYHFVDSNFFSDVYIEDASFLRMDNLTLGYTIPRFRGMQQARIFGTVQNVFTLTNYTGVDPEAGLLGIDNNIYPRSRTFSTGVNVVF